MTGPLRRTATDISCPVREWPVFPHLLCGLSPQPPDPVRLATPVCPGDRVPGAPGQSPHRPASRTGRRVRSAMSIRLQV